MKTVKSVGLLALGLLCLSTGCPEPEQPRSEAAGAAPAPTVQPGMVRLQDGGVRPAPTLERAAGSAAPRLEGAAETAPSAVPVQPERKVSDEVERAAE